jgi:hypothetical protein
MAKQASIIKLNGTIGGITFYKTQDGYLAKEKSGVDASRIANDPNFQRTRENGTEFGSAGKAGKTLRVALRTLLQDVSDNRLVSRLTAAMVTVLQADTTSLRGQRNIIDGETTLLEGFDFNIKSQLNSTLFAPYTTTIDRVAGSLTVNIPAFNPLNMITTPSGTTHFKIVSAGTEVDFEGNTSVTDAHDSGVLPWDATETAVINLANVVTANSTHPLFLVLGVEFYQQVNGQQYSLKNGAYNALAIVKVSTP